MSVSTFLGLIERYVFPSRGVTEKIRGNWVYHTTKKTLLISVYAPNGAKENFNKKLGQQLEDYTYDQMVMVGDFNGMVDNKIDKQIKSRLYKQEGKLPKSFLNW